VAGCCGCWLTPANGGLSPTLRLLLLSLRYMGAPTGVDAEAMRLQNEEFKRENEELRSKLQSLTEKVRV